MVKLATLALGLAVAAAASPSFAQSDSTNREQAIHDCNVAAGKYIEHVWGNWPRNIYSSCMAQRSQQE
jgi:hypothetical protein